MKVGGRHCFLCDCEASMALDGKALGRALDAGDGAPATIHQRLCRAEIAAVQRAAAGGEALLIACGQERPLLEEAAADGTSAARFLDIRDRAGWSAEAALAGPKIAALIAEAALLEPPPPPPMLTLKSEGACLILGRDAEALDAAERLAGRLDVTLILDPAGDDVPPPRTTRFPILAGRPLRAAGHLGAFTVELVSLAPALPSSREWLRFAPAGGDRRTELPADLVLDLTGGQPLFPAHEKRDGYLRPDPRDPLAVARALLAAAELVGEFEKPRYISYDAGLCAHARSRRTGCTRCLDQCPTGAIAPDGDHVRIDDQACAGCGLCAAVCPTGAATYAAPAPGTVALRLRTLLATYRKAGGREPVLLIHEEIHGGELIGAMARFGKGLPARVLPVGVSSIGQLGLDVLGAAFAYGASDVLLLAPLRKRAEISGLEAAVTQMQAILGGLGHGAGRLTLLAEDDPDALEAMLYGLPHQGEMPAGDFLPLGGKRDLMRLAIDRLHATAPEPADLVPLPPGAPFGAVQVEVEGCTLCLACTQACPTGALLDAPDGPALRFLEEACVQCGLCQSTCPEQVIRLEPRLNRAPAARAPQLVKEEAPALCVRCGKAFGTQSSIDRILAKLAERHPMFQAGPQIERIRMCADCRVVDQFAAKDPYTIGPPPRTRTTEDWLREREERGRGDY